MAFVFPTPRPTTSELAMATEVVQGSNTFMIGLPFLIPACAATVEGYSLKEMI